MKNISEHITYREATLSNTALKKGLINKPSDKVLTRMKLVAENVFEPLRKHIKKPIRITSFYRSKFLNICIGGSIFSQHVKGEAIDIQGMQGTTNANLFHYIENKLDFDQLIWEFGDTIEPKWVHVSYKKTGNRKQVLKSVRNRKGKVKYSRFRR